MNVLLEHRDIVGSTGILARRLPEGRLPTAVRIREGCVNGMKTVMVQWIVDCDFVPIFTGDGNLLLRDNLIRRDGVLCPIPERLAEISGGLLPVLCIDCVCRSDLSSLSSSAVLFDVAAADAINSVASSISSLTLFVARLMALAIASVTASTVPFRWSSKIRYDSALNASEAFFADSFGCCDSCMAIMLKYSNDSSSSSHFRSPLTRYSIAVATSLTAMSVALV